MEQGEQVIKSPWSSWQFGMGYTYNQWSGKYKGRGDKEKEVLERFKGENVLSKYVKSDLSSIAYGTTKLDLESTYEPSAEINVSASVKIKNVSKRTPDIQLQTVNPPSSPQLNIALQSPEGITKPNITSPNVSYSILTPNADPFIEFGHVKHVAHGNFAAGNTQMEGVFWSGVDGSDDSIADKDKEVKNISGYKNAKFDGKAQTDTSSTRKLNIVHLWDTNMGGSGITHSKNIKLYVAGGVRLNPDSGIYGYTPRAGGGGFFAQGKVKIENATVNLYGKAAAVNIFGLNGFKTELNNFKINLYKDGNTIFNIITGDINVSGTEAYSNYIKGNVDINLNTRKNSIFVTASYNASYQIKNSGIIKMEGASNIFYSGLAYVPNSSNYLGKANLTVESTTDNTPLKHISESEIREFIPLVQTDKYIEQYGDENVTLFFNKSNEGKDFIRDYHIPIGVYQGEIAIKAKIGEFLSSAGVNATEQTEAGNLNSKGYNDKFVEGNVGVFATSGQRKDLKAFEYMKAKTYHNYDVIHNLEIGKFDIRFGKYSKQGFMFLSKLGTVIDVGKSATTAHIGSISTSFTDGLAGADTDDTKAGLESVIAYSEGVFANNAFKLGITTGLEGKSSEIIVHIPLTMTSREGIAYFGDNKGKVTVNADTKATGRKSLIAYAKDEGTINITGNITANDSGVVTSKEDKYKNIGAYAKSSTSKNTEITVNGNININGIGALADGQGSKIYLKGSTNKIYTGTDGALVAKNGGEIEFYGGTIINKNNSAARGLTDNDHKNTTPFYATDKNGTIPQGKISFKTNDTNIEMYDGILVFGKADDYASATFPNPVAKYQGMEKVKVKLMGDGVNLGVFEGLNNVVWAGNGSLPTYTNGLLSIPKFGALDPNGKSFKSTLTDGTLTINSNVNLSDNSDKFNNISMEKELVTINSGKTVTGNGKGLSMGSNSSATSNLVSGYTNKGNVNITGGTISKGVAGINVSYGYISNLGTIKVDNGAGLYGTNGSKLENKGNISLTGKGQGIVGISKATGITYGTDSIDIINNGDITIAGNNSTGIYAENNSNALQSNINIKNSSKIKVGDNGVGIALKSTNGSTRGGLITVSGTGNSDIVVGKNSIGLYGENSSITLMSDYGIESKDNGVGIYTTGNSTVGSNKTLKYDYVGSSNGNGIAILYTGKDATNNLHINLNNSTNSSGGLVGVFAKGGGNFVNSGNITGTSKAAEFGIVTENASVNNTGNISLGDADNLMKGNVGIFVKNSLSGITNTGSITAGKNSIGLYGHNINHSTGNIIAGDNGIGVLSQSGDVSLSGGSIQIGKDEAVGVFTSGKNQTITSTNSMTIGDTSYGFAMKGTGYNLTTNNAGGVNLGNDSVFAYSDTKGTITNRTALTTTGNKNYGLYSAGTINNLADINFGTGIGNVGIYSISYTDLLGKEVAGKAVNGAVGAPLSSQPKITVSESNTTSKAYGIGMAAGYADEVTGIVKRIGQIENYGTIKVLKENGIGMYAVGNGSKAINRGEIHLSGKKTVGMYLDQGAIGENYGTITTIPNATNDGIIGVVALNGAILKNYGQIIINSPNGIGFYSAANGKYIDEGGSITVSGTDSRTKESAAQNDTGKEVKGIKIVAPPGAANATIKRENQIVSPIRIDTNIDSANATQIKVGSTILDLSSIKIPSVNLGQASTLGMYIDTSGVNYTNPIQGLSNLTGLKKINLMIGTEASLYTNIKDIEIGQNILKPYNDVISQVSNSGSGSVKWVVNSAGLTWIATVTQNPDFTISKMYLSKIPYTSFAKDKDTYNFMAGLEEKYGKPEQKEKEIFNKINALGKQEGQVFAQAVDEMKGKQYANVQQRIYTTGNILDKEFKNLRTEKNVSKDSNKIKTFGNKGEYKTDTAGIADYKYNAYGVAYVHESEDIKLGKGIGWYTGIVHNTFKFKDIGNSKEEQLQAKLGLFKSRPYDENNSLNWTTSAEVFTGYNKMNRKFLVVDEIYQAKSKYYTYGIGVRNELSKNIRLSEDFSLKAYGALKLEYGRVSKIKEKNGEIKLEVKSNDYISIKPEIGTELVYRHYFGTKTLNTSVGMAYENELGKVANGKNKARVADTNADWFNIRGEKEDRKGNVKFDLNIGLESQRYGITGNVGYDTKGENIRGGLGVRVIF